MAQVSTYEIANICNLTKTGQVSSYHVGDDGDLGLGIEHDFEVMSTGAQSGTVNIVINGKTHALSNNCVKDHAVRRNGKPIVWARFVCNADIGPAADGKLFWDQWTLSAESVTFNAAGKTITAAAGTPFNTGALCAGRKIDLTGTANNNIEITVANITTSVITTVENLVNEGPVATSFATKDDLVWDFVDEANAKSLGGFDDWKFPNFNELISLVNFGASNPPIDTTAFPSTPTGADFWTSTTRYDSNVRAIIMKFGATLSTSNNLKNSNKYYCRLVRS